MKNINDRLTTASDLSGGLNWQMEEKADGECHETDGVAKVRSETQGHIIR